MIRVHKIELQPTQAQIKHLSQCVGVARFAYNWALAEWRKQYAAGGKPNEMALRKQLNAIKRQEFPWMLEVSKAVPQNAIINLGKAFDSFFAKRGKFPRFKKKGEHESARLDDGPDGLSADGRKLRMPVLGWIKMREAVRFSGQIRSATVSRTADKWFVAVAVECATPAFTQKTVRCAGVDLGIKTLATISIDGCIEQISGPKPHTKLLECIKRLSRSLSRKQPGSANRRKAKTKLARLHYRVTCIRKDALHKLTTKLATTCERICIEDLNVKGMASNRHLARSIMDASFFEFRRQLAYKATIYGSTVVVADRWYPSSKMCSCCGAVQPLCLSDRTWLCGSCGTFHDRDANAARNLENIAASSAVTVCGAEGTGVGRKINVKPSATKQKAKRTTRAIVRECAL